MSLRYKAVYQNDIGSIEFSVASRIIIEGISSLTKQSVDFSTTQSSGEIGEIVDHQHVKNRTLTVKGTIIGKCDAIRQQMTHVIAPLAKGKLIFDDDYEMEVYVKSSPEVERSAINAKFSFSLYAPYPYWRRKEKDVVTLVGITPLFKFPWNISDPNPFKFSEASSVGFATVVNDGEAPVRWTIDFLALDEVSNPSIYNMASGETIRIFKKLAQGEQLSISTEGDELTVTCISPSGRETDGFRFLDINSELFELVAGENYIKIEAESNIEALRANISFRTAFVGV